MSVEQRANYLLDESIPFDRTKVNVLESVVADMNSGDVAKINSSNHILTKLKSSQNLFANINIVLSACTQNQTILYILVTFQQQLKQYWRLLNEGQKGALKQYFDTLFNTITPTDDPTKSAIYKKIKTILVRIFILDFKPSDPFVFNLIEQAKTDQFKCETNLDIFSIMADESEQYGFQFLEDSYPQILTLAAMVLKSTHEAKIKSNLIKNSMVVLEKFCQISKSIIFPYEIVLTLLQIFKSNRFRIQICNLLSVVCSHSLDILVEVTKGVSSILDWNCSIEAYRDSIRTKSDNELVYTDLFLRAYSNLILKLIQGHLSLKPPSTEEYLKVCYGIVLSLTQSQDRDTWVSCRQAWIIYTKNEMNLLNLQGLSNMIVFKCQAPIELKRSQVSRFRAVDEQEGEQEQDQQCFSTLVSKLAGIFTQSMYNRIWTFVESQTFVKFNKERFVSCTYAFCHLNPFITDKNKIINMLKLLMNISQSVEVEHKRTVVDQFLTVVSFYPSVVKENLGLATVLEDKYIQNVENCIKAFLHYNKLINLSPQGIAKVESKITQFGNEKLSLQQSLWEIILRSEGNSVDIRLKNQELKVDTILPLITRNYGGLKVFGLNWNLRWDIIHQIVQNLNSYKSSSQLGSSTEKKHLKKIQQMTTHLCELYYQLCIAHSVNINHNQIFVSILHSIKNWEGYQKLESHLK